MVAKLSLPSYLQDKIFEIKFDSDDTVSKIISYFPLNDLEIKEILFYSPSSIIYHVSLTYLKQVCISDKDIDVEYNYKVILFYFYFDMPWFIRMHPDRT